MSHSAVRFMLCTVGMLIGLAIDVREGRFAGLMALCVQGDRELFYWMQLHMRQLPAMHVGMLVGSALSGMRGLGCLVFMWLGMNIGVLATFTLPNSIALAPVMIIAMTLGMACGERLGNGCVHSRLI